MTPLKVGLLAHMRLLSPALSPQRRGISASERLRAAMRRQIHWTPCFMVTLKPPPEEPALSTQQVGVIAAQLRRIQRRCRNDPGPARHCIH
jgi:hypothetical protein